MAREKKVYLPKWIAWMVTVILLPVWAWITNRAFTDPKTKEELGLVGWLVVSIVIFGSIVMVFLVNYPTALAGGLHLARSCELAR